jgi:hypothetical protein
LSITFVDFEKAFDSICRSAISQCLKYHGVPVSIIDAIMDLYDNTSARTRTGLDLSDPFQTTSGVLQGNTLAPFLFVVILDATLRDAQLTGYTVQRRRSSRSPAIALPFLAFADDIALLNNNTLESECAVSRLYTSAKKVGLKINAKKTQVMNIGLQSPTPVTLPSGETLVEVTNFTYLGGRVADADSAITARRTAAWIAAFKLSQLFHSQASDTTKVKLFKSAVEPVLFYSLEAIALTPSRQERLNQCHRALARFALGVHYPNVIKNSDLRDLGIHDASLSLSKRRKDLLTRATPDSALSIVLSHPPTERLRRGAGRLHTFRSELSSLA